MEFVEGRDYFVRFVRFPNRASAVCVTPNDDGTFSVYGNLRYPIEEVRKRMEHEIAHMAHGDFWRDEEVSTLESEADHDEA